MKNFSFKAHSLALSFFMVVGLSANAMAQTDSKAGKYTGPKPVAAVNSHNGSLVPVGSYIFINKYFNVTKDQLYSDNNEVSFTPPLDQRAKADAFYYQELQTVFRTGIAKNIDARFIFSTFEKRIDRQTATLATTDINKGIGDAKLIARYGLMSQKDSYMNLIAGVGVTVPFGSTDETDNAGKLLPGSMQLGSGSWNPILELGMHKIIRQHWVSAYFSAMFAVEGELGPHDFTRSNAYKYTFAYNYAVSHMWDVGVELNGEIKNEAELNENEVINTGGHTVFLSPQVHFKFAKNMHLGLCAPIAVYHDLNGPQLGYETSVIAKLSMKF
ncbi:MAG: transporter [Desulfocapsa sp.]|nr:transporter [Desulfocapsa sp.]